MRQENYYCRQVIYLLCILHFFHGICCVCGLPLAFESEPEALNQNDFKLKNGSRSSEVRSLTRAFYSKAKPWTDGIVYYEYGSSFPDDQREKVKIAMQALQKASCIKFSPKTKSTSSYVVFENFYPDEGPLCIADIGMQGGRQYASVPMGVCETYPANYAGSIVHELMHTLGFLHEFQRTDSANYVKYEGPESIEPIEGKSYGIPFNWNSITQYDSAIGFKEVKPRKAGVPAPVGNFKNMGQECRISVYDRILIDTAYKQECRLKSVPKYKTAIIIPGTDCNHKHHPMSMDDEAGMP